MRKLFLILMAVVACSISALAQNRTITGKVVDAADNEPLIGVSVIPVGGGVGTQTDYDGNFSVSVPANVSKATFSYVGYEAKTEVLKSGMTVKLSTSSSVLDDLVVVAYGTSTKESLTGSVAVVGAKEIEDRPVTSVTSALEGNAPGVQVNSTVGQPGQAPAIRIRGFSSVTGNNAPIYVVDGVIFDGSIADINPADIESMTVLKDAASTALYGNKGSNGAILITTKKAKNVGKVDVTLSVRQGMYNRGVPEYDRLDANQWMQQQFWGKVNGDMSLGIYDDMASAIAGNRGSFVESKVMNNIWALPSDQLYDENGIFTDRLPMAEYSDRDWWKIVSRNGYRQEYNINAAAAGEKYNVFASVGYLKEQGYLLRTDFERYNARLNTNFNPVKYFRFGVNLAATYQNSEINQFQGDTNLAINPFLTMFTAPVYSYYAHDALSGQILYDENGEPMWNRAGYLGNRNIGLEIRKNYSNYNALVADANIYGTAVIPYGFELTLRANMHRDKTVSTQYMNKIIGDAAPNGSITKETDQINYHTFMQQLFWSHEYGSNYEHHVDALFGHENYESSVAYDMINMSGQTYDDIYGLSNFEKYDQAVGGTAIDKTESFLARARYNYAEKYFGEISFRRDGSSRFAKSCRWGNFWSIGGSWIITKEKFMNNLTWLDYLKLRAAYGTVGNNASAGTYAYWSQYGITDYNGTNILYRATLADPSIKWETTETFDIGLEGALFAGRLNFTVGYFDKRSRDLLFPVVLPLSAGSTIWSGGNLAITQNIGTMSNRGWELSFNGDIIRNKDWRWSASIDATFLKNKIKKLPNGNAEIPSGVQRLAVDHSIYEFYTYEWAGVDQMNGQSLYEVDLNGREYAIMDADGNAQVNEALLNEGLESGKIIQYNDKYYTYDSSTYGTRKWMGTALPTVYGSFGTSAAWKGLSLNVLFTYSLGGKTYDSNYISLMSTVKPSSALHVDALNAWNGVPEGMTPDSPNRIDPNGVPQLNYTNSPFNDAQSSRWLISSNWLVFKNLTISYDLPKKWMNAILLQGINVGFSVDNIVTISKRKGMNPSASFAGGQSASFVTPRVFSFQLTAKF